MAMPAPWPDGRKMVELSVEELGIRILWLLVDRASGRPHSLHSRQGFIGEQALELARQEGREGGLPVIHSEEALGAQTGPARALAEAWQWLETEGMLAPDPVAMPRAAYPSQIYFFVTRWGSEVAAQGAKGLDLIQAKRRLGLELHPSLRSQLQKLVKVGAFEQAAFTALREVEQRVAKLAGSPKGQHGGPLLGDQLMNKAFSPEKGILADPEAEPAEQLGQMNLFKGAFAAFRNPLGHRAVEFADPTEAAEVVLLADLLMRQLDHVSDRLTRLGASG